MFNLIYAHLLNMSEHTPECEEVCSDDCRTRRFLDELYAPLMPWEIEEAERERRRRKELMRGIIPA